MWIEPVDDRVIGRAQRDGCSAGSGAIIVYSRVPSQRSMAIVSAIQEKITDR